MVGQLSTENLQIQISNGLRIRIALICTVKRIFTLCLLCALSLGLRAEENNLKKAKEAAEPIKQMEFYLLHANQLNRQSSDSALLFLDSLTLAYKQSGFTQGMARAMSAKSWYLNFQAKYQEALNKGHEALEIQRSIKDTIGFSSTLNNIAISNLYFDRLADGKKYLAEALVFFKALKDTSLIDKGFNNLGVIAAQEDDLEKAIFYYRKSLKLRIARNNQHWVAFSYYNIGDAFMSMDNLDSGKYYMELSATVFMTKTEHKTVPALAAHGIADMYFRCQDYDKSLDWSQQALQTAKDMNHTEIFMMAELLQSRIYYKLGRYKEAYLMSRSVQKRSRTLDSTNNYAEVADIEEKYKSAEKEAEIAQLKVERLHDQNKQQKLWLIIIPLPFIALLIIMGLPWYYNRKFQKEELKQAALKAQIADTRMLALRAQMNPHFIFNCINTAQNFIMNSEKAAGYEYLSKFASLLRLVLENSSKKYVELDDEIKQIDYYLALENTRFDQKFQYQISVEKSLKNELYEIPGMLIQPLVENSILHGLLHRNDAKGQLEVSFVREGEFVLCQIKDNGIGRQAAQKIKAKKEIHYTSTGIMNIHERLAILAQQMDSAIRLEIEDLYEDNEASGTLAKLWLPCL